MAYEMSVRGVKEPSRAKLYVAQARLSCSVPWLKLELGSPRAFIIKLELGLEFVRKPSRQEIKVLTGLH